MCRCPPRSTRTDTPLPSTALFRSGSDGALHFGHCAAGASVPGQSQARLVRIEQDILARNDAIAADNRRTFADAGVLALNLMSSPGAGKTSLLVATLALIDGMRPAVIAGYPATSAEAEARKRGG